MLTEAFWFWFAVATWVVCVAVCVPFLAAIREEVPSTYEAWGRPSAFGLLFNRRIWWPFSGMVLSGRYRVALAQHPRARAWASWLFLVHWLQLVGAVAFVASLLLLATNEF